MREDSRARLGAAAGAIAVLLFLAGALVIGERPAFDSPGAQVAEFFDSQRTRIQIGVALDALAVPLLLWFLVTVAALARSGGPDPGRTGTFAAACGAVFLALFLADLSALAVGALRPENMAADPELASALQDYELLLMGAAAPLGAATLAGFAVLTMRHGMLWPRWLGWLAAIAAAVYALRIGTLFTTEGAFAADGLLGLYLPVSAFSAWLLVASALLVFPRPGRPPSG